MSEKPDCGKLASALEERDAGGAARVCPGAGGIQDKGVPEKTALE